MIKGVAANPSAPFALSSFQAEWSTLALDNKNFSIKLLSSYTVIDALGVDSDSTGNEVSEGTPVSDLSKQKIVIRLNDADTNDNASDFETVSFKSALATDTSVTTYLAKLGQTA